MYPNVNIQTIHYVHSEAEFRRAKMMGWLEVMKGLVTGQDPYPLSFAETLKTLRVKEAISQGLRDVTLKNILGSAGYHRDFSRCFFP